jgi:hypothetical protein
MLKTIDQAMTVFVHCFISRGLVHGNDFPTRVWPMVVVVLATLLISPVGIFLPFYFLLGVCILDASTNLLF